MLKWIKKKLSESKDWRTTHENSWVGFDKANDEGITKFQESLLCNLKSNFDVEGLEMFKGENEVYYKGTIASSRKEFYIYSDEAEFNGVIIEKWACNSRQDLEDIFIQLIYDANI